MALNGNSKPMYQPWNEEEFNADIHVRSMTPIQRWIYRTLLLQCFFHTTRPYLPADDGLLWKLAGCENKKQWDKNKADVLAMFSEIEQDGQVLLSNKRVLEDWNRLQEKREIGRSSAQKRWDGNRYPLGSHDTPNASEVELSEVKGSEEKKPWSAPKLVNLKKVLPVLCLKLLKHKAEPTDWWKTEIQELADAFGSGKVAEAFEMWASTRQGEIVNKPVSEFLRTATGYLEGSFGQAQPEIDQLLARLYESGGQAFAGKAKATVVRLVNEYGIPDVESAYKEFITNKDEHDMKYAVRDFAEGGAVAIILAQRRRKQESAAVEAVMADNRKEMERLAEEEQTKVFEQEQLEAGEIVEAFDFGG